MANLITATEFASFRNVSIKRDDAKIDEAISLAQQSDLLEILGEFYFDVIKNAAEASYSELMNGSEFEYNGESFEHAGIKKLLADYAYSRYIYMKPVNDTAFGFIVKETQDGTPVDRNYLKDMQKQAQVDAGVKFKFIELYILANTATFPRYCTASDRDKYLKDRFSVGSFSTQKFSKL
ncbi:MAG: hypothetical protein PVG07_00095 [Acidobacteriota bacterium]|jgi:hypothetical protein